ncbi:hypothetical protein B4123_0313 [Bacillus paralicheniformis]|nr:MULTISPECIES: hypothetical protein [Bacillus]MDE1382575.1 hypothetical protein [Bacillus paralicheniformis]OLG13225.1 hypothetical protein B4123_0313 [Bacillus paralicheniformis]TWJ50405.1 hypothetical protein CHCC5023_3178 [Bacillus paralicheniformis]TWJ75331.1 hypothetical protein CHCC5019_2002 [Bacillus paralicheniformis]TWN97975.1 hypothetical protein CHCC20490_0838 [Bacillus paralicheniformis]
MIDQYFPSLLQYERAGWNMTTHHVGKRKTKRLLVKRAVFQHINL